MSGLRLGAGTAEQLTEQGTISLVLSLPTDPTIAASVLVAAAEDLHWLDTPPVEEGDWLIPSLVSDVRVIAGGAYVRIDAGDADPELLARIPGIVERHLLAFGNYDAVLSVDPALGVEDGESFDGSVTSLPVPPPKPATAEAPRLPRRPGGAEDLSSRIWNIEPTIGPRQALEWLGSHVVVPLLEGAGRDASTVREVLRSMGHAPAMEVANALRSEIDALIEGLEPHDFDGPESRDPLIWSGIDAALIAPTNLSIRTDRSLPSPLRDVDAPTDVALYFALHAEALQLLTQSGLRTWGDASGAQDPRDRARMRARFDAEAVAVRHAARWLGSPLLPPTESSPGPEADLLRSLAAEVTTSDEVAGTRDATRERAATVALLALFTELGERAASAIASGSDHPYRALAPLAEQLVTAALDLINRETGGP